MKSSEVALKYDISEQKFDNYIKKYVPFNIKYNFWGDIIIPDNINIDNLVKLFLQNEEEVANQQQQNEQEKRDRDDTIRHQLEELERKEKETYYHLRIEKLKESGAEGYYEYKAISLLDVGGIFNSNSGRVDTYEMTNTLNELGVDGWHLVTAYSNELGKNALSGGAGGALLGVNSTVDENILIFERFVKFT